MTYWEAFGFGIVGGILAEFVYWAKFKSTFNQKKPKNVNWWYYWGTTFGWIIIGGFVPLAYLKGGININFLFCLHAGASAPVFLNQILKGNLDKG